MRQTDEALTRCKTVIDEISAMVESSSGLCALSMAKKNSPRLGSLVGYGSSLASIYL
jgi:hypothetical protein